LTFATAERKRSYNNNLKKTEVKFWIGLSLICRNADVSEVVPNLFGDLDEQEEDDEYKEVVNDTDNSDDDVDNLERKVTDVGQIRREIIGLQRSGVVPDITRER